MSKSDEAEVDGADWQRRVVDRSLRAATKRSIDRGSSLIRAAATLLERSNGDGFTVQDVADEAGQSLRTLYQYFESKDDLLLAVYEEAMRTYAHMIRQSIVDLTDPLERLAGALVASLRMPEFSDSGVDRGLARLRAKLGEVEPQLIARSQEPLTTVFRELVTEASAAGELSAGDPEAAAYLVLGVGAHYITSHTLGDDSGLRLPTVLSVTTFCLQGLGVRTESDWIEHVEARLQLPDRRINLRPRGTSKRPAHIKAT